MTDRTIFDVQDQLTARERKQAEALAAQDAPRRKRAAKADRKAAIERNRPAVPELSEKQRDRLRELARREFELRMRQRAHSAASHTTYEFIARARRQLELLERDLPMARSEATRARCVADKWDDPQRAAPYERNLAELESKIDRIRSDIEASREEQKTLSARAGELALQSNTISQTIDAVLRRVRLTRADLGINFVEPR